MEDNKNIDIIIINNKLENDVEKIDKEPKEIKRKENKLK